MKRYNLSLAALLGGLLLTTACEKDPLDQQNPNQPTTQSFWANSNDAVKGVNAAYSGLQQLGTYRRWLNFAYDLRSDDGFSTSPWGELASFTKFVLTNYNFEVSDNLWRDHYRGIWRTNQVLAFVPNIPATSIDETLRKRVLAEARFLRALHYFNLVSLYGRVPLLLTPSDPAVLPPQATTEAQVWEQVIADLQAAKADLPATYTDANDLGRATSGAAAALLGKAYMQTKQWALASAQFQEVISSGRYRLTTAYTDNFRHTTENNPESIFEVQFSDAKLGGNDGDDATSSEGGQRSQFWGAPNAGGFVDGEVRPWVVAEFLKEGTAAGARDPRLAATVFYNRTQFTTSLPADQDVLVYGTPFRVRYPNRVVNPKKGQAGEPDSLVNNNAYRVYWRKYQTDYYRTFENFDSPINHRVMRYADILLLQAEALNQQGQTANAVTLINQVRSRAGLAPLVAGTFSQASLLTQIMHERVTELTGEGQRWLDLQRWGLLDTQANVDQLKTRDDDFNNFVVGKSRLLPIPQRDIDLANLQQNPGW